MTRHAFPTDCPCGSGQPYKTCCFMYHMEKEHPPTAEALMRSRYSAYALKKAEYLLYSWHPDTRPKTLDLAAEPAKWIGLKIGTLTGGGPADSEGTVAFVARYKIGGRAARLEETSRFARFKGRWVYVDGTVIEPEAEDTHAG